MTDSYSTDDVYAVGMDNNGNTTLRLFADGANMTLRMSEKATRNLIRLLQATLSENEDKVLEN